MAEETFPRINDTPIPGEKPEPGKVAKPGKGLALAALICGISGLFCTPVGIVALVLGIIALVKKTPRRNMALAGVVMGAISFFVINPILAQYCSVAIPQLIKSRVTAFESKAASELGSYRTAQAAYRDVNGQYATPYTKLYDSADAKKCLISKRFAEAAASANLPHNAYHYQEVQTLGGKPIDWTKDFALCATPAVYGRTARPKVFIVSTDGTVWGKDLGKSEFVADFPVDPAKEGWTLAE